MFRLSDHAGYGGAEMRAISALDIALWDIKGQALGVPVYELLGGAVRRRMPVYATGMPYEGAADLARQLLDEGITAMKGGPTIPLALASDGQYLSPERPRPGAASLPRDSRRGRDGDADRQRRPRQVEPADRHPHRPGDGAATSRCGRRT